MKQTSEDTSQLHTVNIFNLEIGSPFWKQFDFWLAIVAAVVFYFVFIFFSVANILPVRSIELSYFFVISLIAFPIMEEVVFRGLIQESLQQLLTNYQLRKIVVYRLSSANLVCSVLFAASHLVSQPWTWALLMFFPSIIFGYFKDKYQSLKPAIILHIFYNMGFYFLLG